MAKSKKSETQKSSEKKRINAPLRLNGEQAETDGKRLADYEQSRPLQLVLFEYLQPADKRFSNTIELYDFMPKYVWGKVERIGGAFLKTLTRGFDCRGRKYQIEISPARLKDKNGDEREYYPSKREELVEDALRRLATAGHGLFLDELAGVTFTLYQLQKELKAHGHSYSITQIKDALLICAKTSITVTTEEGSNVLVSSLFETLGLQTREDWKNKGEKSKAFVRFNSLVTESIKRGSFRQLNYATSMAYKSIIARQLHKRMSHHYSQASITQPYSIMLSTVIRDFGLAEYESTAHNLRNVKKALEEMKKSSILLSYKIDEVRDAESRNKLTDAKLTLTPHPTFAGEVIQANKRQINVVKELEQKR